MDATGPSEPFLLATTMGAMLEAHESRTAQVTVTHHLGFDQDAHAYHVDEAT